MPKGIPPCDEGAVDSLDVAPFDGQMIHVVPLDLVLRLRVPEFACDVMARSQKRLSGLHGRDGRGRTSNTTHEYSIRNACHVTLRYEFPRIDLVILYNTIENAIRKRYAVVIEKPYVPSPGTRTAEHMVRGGSGGDGGSALSGNDGDAAHCQSNVGAASLATDGPPASIDTGHGHRVT